MGIHNRDYYRSEGTSGGWSGFTGNTMCQRILIITVAVYLLQVLITVPRYYVQEMISGSPPEARDRLLELEQKGRTLELEEIAAAHGYVVYESFLQEWGEVDPVKVSQGQVWRLLTYAFLHDRNSPMHIVFNMLVLWMFGAAIEELIGRREFLAFYLVSAMAAGLCHVIFGMAMRETAPAVGASGALMAISMLFAIYYPTAPINLFFFITLEARWLIIMYLIFDTFPILKALSGAGRVSDGVAHAAHLGGLGFGFLYYRFNWKLTDWFPTRGGPSLGTRLTKWWTRPRLRVYNDRAEKPVSNDTPVVRTRTVSPRDMEHRVDEILKKIKEQGEASLTEDERSLLRDASQAYKKKST